jgi:phospholipid/cholesterol/gamma-HCH transport system substrate-binding protein
METRASYVLVGSFVMLCLFGMIVAMLWLTGSQYRQEFAYYRTVFSGGVTGLGRGTTVRFNGIDVGSISELAFDPENPSSVIVTVQIDPVVPIQADAVASIQSQGFTGGTFLEIDGGTANSPLLTARPGEQYPVIPSRPNTLQQLAQAGPELVANFNTVGVRVSDLLNDQNRKLIAESLATLASTLENVRNTTDVFARRSEDLDATLENLRVASASIAKTLGNVDNTLAGADRALASADKALASVDTVVASAKTAVSTADATMQKIGLLSEDARKVINGQGVAQLTQVLAQTRALIASLTRLSQDLEREPSRLIYGDRREGYTPQ